MGIREDKNSNLESAQQVFEQMRIGQQEFVIWKTGGYHQSHTSSMSNYSAMAPWILHVHTCYKGAPVLLSHHTICYYAQHNSPRRQP